MKSLTTIIDIRSVSYTHLDVYKRQVRTLAVALKHPQRWRFIQALPAAAWCLREGVEMLHAHFADENLALASIISSWTGIPYSAVSYTHLLVWS